MKNQILLATNLGRGGISILILTADESKIKQTDKSIDTIRCRDFSLKAGELIYGVINDNKTGDIIDEVVICAYSSTCRIITGHGGSASALALLNYFTDMGYSEADPSSIFFSNNDENLSLLQTILPQTKTETQALCCLQAINKLKASEPVNIEEILALLRPRIVTLAGAPNVGKSSLLNLLCGYERVLVSDIAGTTRDAVKDYIDIEGYYTHIIDTAGFRKNVEQAEEEAIKRGKKILKTADLILLVLDSSRELTVDDYTAIEAVTAENQNIILPVMNKSDLPVKINIQNLINAYNMPDPINISCLNETGIDKLTMRIAACFD